MALRQAQRGLAGAFLILLALLPAHPLFAQRARRDVPVSIAEARRDADGDFVPDHLGDTLTVAGYATVGSGVLHASRLQLFLQDDTGGIGLFDDTIPHPVAEGDSLIVTGIVAQRAGLTHLRPLYYSTRRAQAPPPSPMALTIAQARDERYEGMLVTVKGRVLLKDRASNGGQYLTLMDPENGEARLQVYAERQRGNAIDLLRAAAGDLYRVTGIVAQFDREEPLDAGYQLHVRSQADLTRSGLSNRLFRQMTYAGLLLLILALAGVIRMRGQVLRHTRQLTETDKRFRSIYEGVLDIILVADAERLILAANPEACRVLGYPEAVLRTLHLNDLSDDVRWDDVLHHTPGTKPPVFEACLRTRTGQDVFVGVRANRIEIAGQEQWLLVMHDITQRKKYEAQLIAAKERAEEMTRLKSSFLANMSHEVRTPMNGVIGMTSLLEQSDLTPEQREYVTIIRRSGDALLSVIDDILDFSKIEANQLTLEKQPLSVRAYLEEALDVVALRASEKGLALAYILEPETPSTIVGDVTRLRQILVNLLSNAVKFTETGEVIVRAALESRTAERCVLSFSVRDTGIGIPEEHLGRLFESFTQLDASTTRKYGGTGLGLAISQRLCTLMGGAMRVESTAGAGSTFTFTIEAEEAGTGADTLPDPDLAGRQVLLVQPNEALRESLVRQLDALGLGVDAVATGEEAHSLLDGDAHYAAALIEGALPGASEALAACPPALPVVVLHPLGDASGESPHASLRLPRPVKLSRLREVLTRALSPASPVELRRLAPPHPAPAGAPGALRILLAEDNPINQKVALRMLARLGYEADLVETGLEVLRALETQSYDVVFMDVQMPEMDGLEAARRIRERYGERSAPHLVALTANAMGRQREECLAAGMQYYLSKPVKLDALRNVLEHLARLHTPPAASRSRHAAS
ncbi:ATP-binding protein [Rhodocaloribacter sp.]